MWNYAVKISHICSLCVFLDTGTTKPMQRNRHVTREWVINTARRGFALFSPPGTVMANCWQCAKLDTVISAATSDNKFYLHNMIIE